MPANGIAHLPTREARQLAKLEIAQLKRRGYKLNADGTVASGPTTNNSYYRENNYTVTKPI